MGLFLVEGEKNIEELLGSHLFVEEIHGTDRFLGDINVLVRTYEKRTQNSIKLVATTEEELVKMGSLMSNNAGIAVVQFIPQLDATHVREAARHEIVLALDDVRDPGNLGTIMRIADWFGVKHIVASRTTTDVYNPKTIAASMGSFTRVSLTYLDLFSFFSEVGDVPVFGADIEGTNINEAKLPTHGILLMGSESHGLSSDIVPLLTLKLTIPRYGGAESLNVAVATGILLAALRSRSSVAELPLSS